MRKEMEKMNSNNDRLFLDIHILQTVPPSNINRDDTGSPKTAQYGGVRRARVSSQAWKKAIREYFSKNSDSSNVGIRTMNLVDYIKNKIIELNKDISEESAKNMAKSVIEKTGIKLKDEKTKALFFIGEKQAIALANAAINNVDDKIELQSLLNDNPAIDIALFGRMVADDPSLNEDASSQIAHAISTHAIQTEFDFFTAVDDMQKHDGAGAGMLGTIEYNSSTLYRYANVAVHELYRQLGDIESTVNAIKLFVEAFSNSMPTGKANTFANQTLPQLIIVELRKDRPVNLVNAFEVPVKSKDGYVKESVRRLFTEENKVKKFVETPIESCYLSMQDVEVETSLTKLSNLNELIDLFGEKIYEIVNE